MAHKYFGWALLATLFSVITFGHCASAGKGIRLDNPLQGELAEAVKNFPYKETIRGPAQDVDDLTCNLSPDIKEEIKAKENAVEELLSAAISGRFQGKTFDLLRKFVDEFGPRVAGSKELEDSITYLVAQMKEQGLTTYEEEVVVPHYMRGLETAQLISPRKKNLPLLGLVPSVGTPPEGITAEVLVVKSFEDLQANAEKAKGKIIVFNQEWNGYGGTVQYRSNGANHVFHAGGKAALIKSIAPFSMVTPHTGGMNYWDNVTDPIPAACITSEDAELFQRLQDEKKPMTINLKMLNYKLPPTTSRNAIGEIRGHGAEEQYELVGVSGHIDSWDVGDGAMDDAGGVYISAAALYLIKELINDKIIPQPLRTLQVIAWTAEEVGLVGVADYVNKHAEKDLANFSAIFESDGGVWTPVGLDFAGSDEAACILKEILNLKPFVDRNMNTIQTHKSVSSDISALIAKGVPGVSLKHEYDNYFWYHHTEADVLNVLTTEEMDLATGLWAASSYVLADLKQKLPRRAIS